MIKQPESMSYDRIEADLGKGWDGNFFATIELLWYKIVSNEYDSEKNKRE
jgi:hypothetical protein